MTKVKALAALSVPAGRLLFNLTPDQVRRRRHLLEVDGDTFLTRDTVNFKAGEVFEIDSAAFLAKTQVAEIEGEPAKPKRRAAKKKTRRG